MIKSNTTNNNNVVTKSNSLIESNYNLTITEHKIILFLISEIRIDDVDFKQYTLSIKEFNELLGNKGDPKYTEMREITKTLMSKVLEIKEGKKVKQLSWLSYVEYNENEGSVNLTFDPHLKPYLLELKENFTSYKLKYVMGFKSNYSIRIYEVLKKWQKIKVVEISVEELRKMLGATNKYKEYHNFKKRILVPSQQEISKKSDILFDFKEIKKARKVHAIRFVIFSKDDKKILELEKEKNPVINPFEEKINKLFDVYGYKINSNVFKRWIKLSDKIYGKKIIEDELETLIMQMFMKKDINNPVAFLTYILNEKVKLIEDGKDHEEISLLTIKKDGKDIVPEWFEEFQNKSKSKDNQQIELDFDIEEERKRLQKELATMS